MIEKRDNPTEEERYQESVERIDEELRVDCLIELRKKGIRLRDEEEWPIIIQAFQAFLEKQLESEAEAIKELGFDLPEEFTWDWMDMFVHNLFIIMSKKELEGKQDKIPSSHSAARGDIDKMILHLRSWLSKMPSKSESITLPEHKKSLNAVRNQLNTILGIDHTVLSKLINKIQPE